MCCVGSGLYNELTARLQESYRCVCVRSRNLNNEDGEARAGLQQHSKEYSSTLREDEKLPVFRLASNTVLLRNYLPINVKEVK